MRGAVSQKAEQRLNRWRVPCQDHVCFSGQVRKILALSGGNEKPPCRISTGGRGDLYFNGLLEAHGYLVTDHDDVFHITVAVSLFEQVSGFHVSEMDFVIEVVEQLIDKTQVSLPA